MVSTLQCSKKCEKESPKTETKGQFSEGRGCQTIRPSENLNGLLVLHDRKGKYNEERWNPPHMVVIEHRHGRVWAHRVPNKGIHKDASWLPKRMVQDLDNTGLQSTRIIIKSDQEPVIIDVQTAMQELRFDMIIPINSPLGESESIGRAENSIKRVQGKVRIIRHHVGQRAQMRIPDDPPIMAWMVRWAAELLSKHSRDDDGKCPYERIRGEPSKTPLVPSGEKVLYLLLRTVKGPKGDLAKKPGIWLGINERTEANIFGTDGWGYQMSNSEQVEPCGYLGQGVDNQHAWGYHGSRYLAKKM